MRQPHFKSGKQSRATSQTFPHRVQWHFRETLSSSQCHTHSHKLSHTVLTQHILYATFIFNQLRSWCIFQQGEVLDGNFRNTAVKAVQQCITQHVIQSWSLVFTPLLLSHYRQKSELLHLPWRQRERCTSIIHGICGLVEWTGRSKLATFCSNAGQSPRGANYYVSPSERGQNNQNSSIFPWV